MSKWKSKPTVQKKMEPKNDIFIHVISHIQYAAKIFVMFFSPYFDTFMCFLLCISVSVGQYHSESGSNVSQPCGDQSETLNLVAHLIFY